MRAQRIKIGYSVYTYPINERVYCTYLYIATCELFQEMSPDLAREEQYLRCYLIVRTRMDYIIDARYCN